TLMRVDGISPKCCKTLAALRRGARTSRSSSTIRPPSRCASPGRQRSKVVCPQPDGPRMQSVSLSWMASSSPSNTVRAPEPNRFVALSTTIRFISCRLLLRPRGGCGGAPDDEMHVHGHATRIRGLALDPCDQEVRCADPHLTLGNVYGRERRAEEFGERHVIEPHERHVGRALELRLASRAQDADRAQVVGAEDRGRRVDARRRAARRPGASLTPERL